MLTPASPDRFYTSLPVFRDFTHVMDPGLFRPLPDDWVVGTADIVQSTKAIAENRYKAVNMAGASVIVAITHALEDREFPFVFGGDGASFAVPAADADIAREALVATAAWVRDDLDLTLRIGMVTIGDIRAQGFDVRVARYGPSEHIAIAMFAGGGIAWADAAMKRGEIALAAGPPGARPDLSGLSCRFEEIKSSRGVVLSLVVAPIPGADMDAFRAAIEDIARIVEKTPDASRPVPGQKLKLTWPPQGFELEVRASRKQGEPLWRRRIYLLAYTFFAFLIMRFGITAGQFIPAKYTRELIDNSDFRKFDDALRMVLDCTVELADEIEAHLAERARNNILRYGTHRQHAAMMTCFTPSPTRSNHVHFVDGALGGYAMAASQLKRGL
ncbi:DUF3095 domain-containing protein [Rhodoplanes sp. Z2-YC6860]|uniref:DUF3095 domain-containing protein n=1 Tax=Rhodoplanes sp. Z2-YC6860 TaxID=674703 RepID=UPI00078D71F5|nr:DUF3095 domain-containing protein [Rhodoplanes sp. Z2-YC6860]AMN45357.1 adenylate cyclase [Rhodoplanes sp. Z2-YC6860]